MRPRIMNLITQLIFFSLENRYIDEENIIDPIAPTLNQFALENSNRKKRTKIVSFLMKFKKARPILANFIQEPLISFLASLHYLRHADSIYN